MSAGLQDETGFERAPVVWLGSVQSSSEPLATYLDQHPKLNFRVTTLRRGGSTVLVLEGELDMATVGELDTALQDVERQSPTSTVLDLTGLRFLDCSGLHRFVAAQRRIADGGGSLKLVPAPAHVQRIFTLTRVESLFEFVDHAGVL